MRFWQKRFGIIVLAGVILFSLAACDFEPTSPTDSDPTENEQAVKPVASPAGGNYTGAQNVTLTTATQGAGIYYTLDGTVPTSAGARYTSPIVISVSGTLRAIAVKTGMTYSEILTETYTINPADIVVAFSNLTANGFITSTTTKLTLTFNRDITGLTASDITLNAGSTGAVKGTLTRTGTGVYELTVSGIHASGAVTVSVSKSGYTITGGPKAVSVNYYIPPADIAAAFTSLAADGSLTSTTTTLTLTFDKNIAGLSAANVTLNAGSTGAVKGNLTGTGTGVYELAVSGITTGGTVSVSVNKSGYSISGIPKTTTVFHYIPPTDIAVTFTGLTAEDSIMYSTSTLFLTFDKDIEGLTAEDLTLNAGSTGLSAGTLRKTGTGTYEWDITGITASGTVSVTVSKSGYAISGGTKTAPVYFIIPAAFISVTADGSDTASTTKLTLTFDKDLDNLSVGDIGLMSGTTGAQKGELNALGDGVYELGISGITSGGTITVTVSKSGYYLPDWAQEVTIFLYSVYAFTDLSANGSAEAATTRLTLQFDKDVFGFTGFTSADITFDAGSTGAVKGVLTRTGTGTYNLAVTGITAAGTVSVTVADKAGHGINPNTKSVTVFPEPGTYFSHIDFTGPTEKVISIGITVTNNLSISKGGSVTFTITESFDRYEWFVGGSKIAEGNSITLYADNPAFAVGPNWITAVVYTGTGVNAEPWSGEIMTLVNN